MDSSKIVWAFRRLTAMSIFEILNRIIRKLREILYRKKYREFKLITEKKLFNNITEGLFLNEEKFYKKYDDNFRKILLRDYSIYCIELLDYGDRIVDKKLTILNLYPVDFSKEINWHRAFNEDKNWPLIYSPKIDFRQREEFADIRFNWELNRHQFLTTLAVAFYISKDMKYLKSLKEYFYSWVDNNPFMYGVSWISPMEAAIRAFSWMICVSIIKQCYEDEFLEDMERGIKNQIHYVYNNYSLYSSANNHYIVESSLVGIAGILFSNDKWINSGIKNITREIKKQVTFDGVDREQSVHYQAFVMEAITLFLLLLKKNHINYPDIIDKRLEKMNIFLSDILNIKYNPPNIGDNDEGCILNVMVNNEKFNYYKYVLQLGQKLFNSSKYIKDNGLKTYKDGGYSIFRYEDKDKERLLIFDHGFLGYKALCAHGHADALSITLSVDGGFVFIDPGTYIYNIEREFRDYFRKTINHNTIEIDGKDQSQIKGAFIWGKKAKTKLKSTGSNEDNTWVYAEHYGYRPLIHSREVKFFMKDTFIINDYIKGKCNKLVQSFILGKEVQIEQFSERAIIIKSKTAKISVCCKGRGSFTIEKVLISPYFGRKEIATAIRKRIDNVENETLQTIIRIDC